MKNQNGSVVLALGYTIAFLTLALFVTGCSGIGVRAEAYRIDTHEEHTETFDKSMKCIFGCDGEQTTHVKGS